MDFQVLSSALVDAIHDAVLNPGELPGRAPDKSLEGALARVENRLAYGMIEDVFDLAAAYAVAIAQGHCFNDGNKRTAYRAMQTILDLHAIIEPPGVNESGDLIIRVAQRQLDEAAVASWLRKNCA